jgi:uracil phosphoribosyltransferase
MKPYFYLSDHALAATSLRIMRDEASNSELFRAALRRVTTLLAVEALREVPLEEVEVQTPLKTTAAARLGIRVGVVPILRAGLGMVEPVLELLPEGEVWHLGLFRDEKTLEPVTYYSKLPSDKPVDMVLMLDPMLATGGSACAAVEKVKAWGVKDIRFLSVLTAPEGKELLQSQHPDVALYTAALDEKLNEQGYIVPGLGDAGDRAFNAIAE